MHEKLDINSYGQYWFKNGFYWISFKDKFRNKLIVIKSVKNENGINFINPFEKNDSFYPEISWFDDAEYIEYKNKINFNYKELCTPRKQLTLRMTMKNENIQYENLTEKGKKFIDSFKKMIQDNLRSDNKNVLFSYKIPTCILIDNNFMLNLNSDCIKSLMTFSEIPLSEVDDILDFLKLKNFFIPERLENDA